MNMCRPGLGRRPPADIAPIKAPDFHDILDQSQEQAVEEALRLAEGNKAKAARLLGIHRASLYKKLGRRP